MPESYAGVVIDPGAAIVGAAMDERIHQSLDEIRLTSPATDQTYDATHQNMPREAPFLTKEACWQKSVIAFSINQF
ncbi:MAG TPA: hypothetical protein VH392_05425 [Sphingomicrobium sp.]|jgi:hypothetical protein